MTFLVLAYGSATDWNALTADEQASLLAQDDALLRRGSLLASVEPWVTTVRAWDGTPATTDEPFAPLAAPLAGFGIIEADDLQHAVQLVANTPCARARGAVELRAINQFTQGASVVS